MKIKELRIGNWIHFDNMIGWSFDERITPRTYRQVAMDNSDDMDVEMNAYFTPIPLTEEWLIKFGFWKGVTPSKDEIKYYKDNFYVSKTFSSGWVLSSLHYDMEEMKYVHQLQNLYFALTGNELTIIKL